MGLGDVRVAALTAGVLGWTGWATLWQGQVLIVLWAGSPRSGCAGRSATTGGGAVPMGPAIIVGSLLALWL